MSVIPNFIVIGSMKSGTSTLCSLIGQHPEVFMSLPKEPEFFCKNEIYAKGWEWYLSLFAEAGKASAIGEGSTSYTKVPLFANVPERIAKHIPRARLIYIVRHPLERIESHWMHRVRHGDTRSFKKMLKEYPNLIDTSRYWFQIQEYRKYFGDEQILVLFFDELKNKPESVLTQCFKFLGVDPEVKLVNPAEHRHATGQFTVESALLQNMRENALIRLASRILPPPVKNALREKFEFRIDSRPEWNDDLRRWVISELSGDVRTFLEYYGKPADYWDLSAEKKSLSGQQK